MSESNQSVVTDICARFGNDRTRMMDIASLVQAEFGCIDGQAMDVIAGATNAPRVEVEGVVSFYSFFSEKPLGKIVIRLSDDIIDRLQGYDRVRAAFEEELGIRIGETTPDGRFTLERTACIGMCDQAPAALINEVVVTELSSDKAREIVRELRQHGDPRRLIKRLGDGFNADPRVAAMVQNNIRQPGPIVFSPTNRGEAVRKALAMSPNEVIRAVKTSRLRGRGGAGFPTGMKWEFTRMADGHRKFVFCNADEGEPGTFKDRVILTERPDRVIAGMTIAGYAIGAAEGVLYLRGEYTYLRPLLEDVLAARRQDNLLGRDILGKGFDFDVRIQMGAGAYVCGEETALLSSAEGRRGDPKNRPPFPAQQGFLGLPTAVNNVETLAKVTRILEEGPATFSAYGSKQSSGTKLLSISGDCRRPGIYELAFGTPLRSLLELAGGEDAQAVQVGGPSGALIAPADFDRLICFDDLTTGGAIMVFGPDRDLLEVVHAFMEFFEDESCGYCTPCRVGNTLLRQLVGRVCEGRGEPSDLDQMREIGATMKATSRCGLGQTSANPVLTSLRNFPHLYEERVVVDADLFRRSFDLELAARQKPTPAGGPSESGEKEREGISR